MSAATGAPVHPSPPGAGSRTPLVRIARDLSRSLTGLRFAAPVACVYNPLEYAWEAHRTYLERFGNGSREILLVGMNPGPWGMAQNGIPFGDVASVRDWLGIECAVGRPAQEHPRVPVLGFACRRREVSGTRLWGWARERFATPERFFERFLVLNYCPLCFLEAGGRNRTPDRLARAEREPLLALCDAGLRAAVEALAARRVIGIGRFAAERIAQATAGLGIALGSVPHPSPANPAANRGWAALMDRALHDQGVVLGDP